MTADRDALVEALRRAAAAFDRMEVPRDGRVAHIGSGWGVPPGTYYPSVLVRVVVSGRPRRRYHQGRLVPMARRAGRKAARRRNGGSPL